MIFLAMHRSGSSATVGMFHAAGLALGSAPLLGPTPSNPHGHFESEPCVELNKRLLERLHGFSEDLPPSRELLVSFVRSEPLIADADRYATPADVEAGTMIADMLCQAGTVSGLKDPRMPLLWGFWRRILDAMRGIDLVPVLVLRPPDAIARSIAARSGGRHGYGDALLATERHLLCMRAIAETLPTVNVVRFGTGHFDADVARVARTVNLRLSHRDLDRCIDRTCIHFTGHAVDHPAEALYQELCHRYGR